MRNVAIILSAGKGTRMESSISKQYIDVLGKPVIYYTLDAFENSIVDEIILVISEQDRNYVEETIINKYGFHKIKHLVCGGKERYHSVYNALKRVEEADNVLIHDGARPLILSGQIDMLLSQMKTYKACVAGMPVKDTIKIVDENHYVTNTPERSRIWQVQTPQVFRYPELREAYEKMILDENPAVTDDAMVLEMYGDPDLKKEIRLVELSYENIKVTTKEDLVFMKGILLKRGW
ncbi:MAG: 2-C-methyl-D-erythritol 4-phosphate cytidylyltransferase [Lachnospiraceae bacterium]|nr:2-C-methyl-D-erythritol 4-phosphate cytidylyltransferase [Lachnospiraceae bacterium]